MYADGFERIRMDQQIRNLNCGRNCMESLLEWRHGSRYGATVLNSGRRFPLSVNGRTVYHVAYGSVRTQHTAEAEAHRADKNAYGFDPVDYAHEYGIRVLMPSPQTVGEWEDALEDYGPLLVSGHIGAVEALWKGAGHFVLVIGVTADKIIYLDPLGTTVRGGLAFFGIGKRNANQEMQMDRATFNTKVSATSGVLASCPPLPGAGWTNVNSSSTGSQARMAIGGNRS